MGQFDLSIVSQERRPTSSRLGSMRKDRCRLLDRLNENVKLKHISSEYISSFTFK